MTAALLAALLILSGMAACFSVGKAGLLFGVMLALCGAAELGQAWEDQRRPLLLVLVMTACGALWTLLAFVGLRIGALTEYL